MMGSPWTYPEFELKDLHKKIGQLLVISPTESCIAEGDFMEQVWFCDGKRNMYLIYETDIREPVSGGESDGG